jgi:protein-tyrosine-phosphatase
MIEALLRAALAKEKIECTISGAGTGTADGVPASAHAITVMKELGLDISEHRSRQITQEIADSADIFVAASVEHGVTLAFCYGVDPEKIIVPGAGIPDPFGRDVATYRACLEQIKEAMPQLVADIKGML